MPTLRTGLLPDILGHKIKLLPDLSVKTGVYTRYVQPLVFVVVVVVVVVGCTRPTTGPMMGVGAVGVILL